MTRTIRRLLKRSAQRLGFEISWRSVAEPWFLYDRFVRHVQNSQKVDVIFDVGANRGQTVARFRSVFPSSDIYAFEPAPGPFTALREATENDRHLKPFQLALGEQDGQAILFENAADVTSSLLRNDTRMHQYVPPGMCTPTAQQVVAQMRLDTFLRQERLSTIDILKIDAQGYERRILAGAGDCLNPTTIRSLYVEVQFVPLYEEQAWCGEIMELLRSRGYRLFGIVDVAADLTHGWKWADAMFVPETDNVA